MRWEELTGDQFARAVTEVEGVCLVPLSCVEHHAHHLPLGTDGYIARDLCRRAVAIEPAIVFPDVIFTQILEARHCAGTIALDADLIVRLLDNICREIARNGLKKILIVNAHGGNLSFLRFFAQIQLESPRDYVVYVWNSMKSRAEDVDIHPQWESTVDGHGGEDETSQILAIRPDLVDMSQARDDGEGMPLGRLQSVMDEGLDTGIWWYADHPTHFRGDARSATAEKGERQLASRGTVLARVIKMIKSDEETRRLQDELFERGCTPSAPVMSS